MTDSFFRIDVKLLQKLNFDLSEVVDSRGNNILHYAIFQHDLDLINAILLRAKLDGTIGKLVNHRNVDGTNPLGMAFLFEDDNNLAGIEIASIFADTYEYQINLPPTESSGYEFDVNVCLQKLKFSHLTQKHLNPSHPTP